VRAGQKGPGERDPLAHPAGKMFDEGVPFVGEPELFEPEVDAFFDIGIIQTVGPGDEPEELVNRQFLVCRRRIGCETDVMADDFVFSEDGLSHDACVATGGRVETRQNPHERGFSSAVGSDQAEKLTTGKG